MPLGDLECAIIGRVDSLLVHLLGHGPEAFREFGVECVGGDPGGVGACGGRVVRGGFLVRLLEVPAGDAAEPVYTWM